MSRNRNNSSGDHREEDPEKSTATRHRRGVNRLARRIALACAHRERAASAAMTPRVRARGGVPPRRDDGKKGRRYDPTLCSGSTAEVPTQRHGRLARVLYRIPAEIDHQQRADHHRPGRPQRMVQRTQPPGGSRGRAAGPRGVSRPPMFRHQEDEEDHGVRHPLALAVRLEQRTDQQQGRAVVRSRGERAPSARKAVFVTGVLRDPREAGCPGNHIEPGEQTMKET